MFNRSEILRSAWADYRRDVRMGIISRTGPFNRDHFAYALRMAWAVAKERATKAAALPAGPVETILTAAPLLPAVAARLAEIEAELQAQNYSDTRIDWNRRRDLYAERAALAA